MFDSVKSRFPLMVCLLISACLLTYYFRNVLGTGSLFTHFFYVPIVLACVWWQKRGLFVTLFLLLVLVFSHFLATGKHPDPNGLIRITMLFCISAITVALSEKLDSTRWALSVSETKYRTIFENTGTAMAILDRDKTIYLVNREFEKISGYRRGEVEGKKFWPEFVDPNDRNRMTTYHWQRRQSQNNVPGCYEFNFISRSGNIIPVLLTIEMIPGTDQSVASMSDISELKRITEDQQILEQRLTNAMERALSGFIPICANCKRVRDETQNWIQIESYIKAKTQADFSHGICPQCKQACYPELYL